LQKKITIIGAGASALMLACELDCKKFEVDIFERNAAPARKFLVAGDGGLNLTHSEPPEKFLQRFTPFKFLEKAFTHFSNFDFVRWLNGKGIETFVGSSGRIFPKKGMKPNEVLHLLVEKAKENYAKFHFKNTWIGFDTDGILLLSGPKNERIKVRSDYTIFCLGGASWPVTGSKGDWREYFLEKGIVVNEFLASNCSFRVDWPSELISKIEGKALKNITVTCEGKRLPGEIVLTKSGLEGSGIYPFSPQIRRALKDTGYAVISLDLKPALSVEKVTERLSLSSGQTPVTNKLKEQLNLTPVQIKLLKSIVSKEDFLKPADLAKHIKNLEIKITGLGPVEDAISTVGGIALSEITENFELKKIPGSFVIGEMLDYDAPTGGYLLQSCFTMGKYLADQFNSAAF
jgi:uncharacterized flavoprotein (TIGR03862 family)